MHHLVRVSLTALMLMLPSAACYTPPSEVGHAGWVNSGDGTESEFEHDRWLCRSASRETVWMAAGYGARQVTLVNEERFVACMNELGWQQS